METDAWPFPSHQKKKPEISTAAWQLHQIIKTSKLKQNKQNHKAKTIPHFP